MPTDPSQPLIPCEEVPNGEKLWTDLEPVWTRLLKQTAEVSAFQSATWIGCWIEHFGSELGTKGLIWRDQSGEPAGCALLSFGQRHVGPFRVSQAFLNASGVRSVGCEHNDIVALPAFRDRVANDLLRRVVSSGSDEFALFGMRRKIARDLASQRPDRVSGYWSESPFVSLDLVRASRRGYLERLSANTRYQVRRSIRLYRDRFGEPTLEVADSGQQSALWLEELVTLHQKRWQARGRAGGFPSESVRGFHSRLLERSAEGNGHDSLSVEIVRVRCGETVIGYLYHLIYGGRVYFYQSGLEYHEDPRLKPGLVAHSLSVQDCLDRGFAEYDFLAGEPYPVRYKRSLSTNARELAWLTIDGPSLRQAMLRRLRGLLYRRGSGLFPRRD